VELLTLTELAERMGVGPTGVKDLLRSGGLLSVRTDEGVRVPAEQLDGQVPVKHLGAVIRLLRDSGYADDEALRWLTTADDTLPGTPLQALHENRATEVKRRAQALAW
jgi:excisionase family DNA binding protein